jgi:hypothetical protein
VWCPLLRDQLPAEGGRPPESVSSLLLSTPCGPAPRLRLIRKNPRFESRIARLRWPHRCGLSRSAVLLRRSAWLVVRPEVDHLHVGIRALIIEDLDRHDDQTRSAVGLAVEYAAAPDLDPRGAGDRLDRDEQPAEPSPNRFLDLTRVNGRPVMGVRLRRRLHSATPATGGGQVAQGNETD